MSVQAIAWALHQQIVKDPGARHVLIGLANHADEIGLYAFPSIELLSKYTGLKRRTVQEKIKLLKELGVIKLEPQELTHPVGRGELHALGDGALHHLPRRIDDAIIGGRQVVAVAVAHEQLRCVGWGVARLCREGSC
ncbi:MAG TPA: hypothetical protein DCE28_14370 [Halomonas sp.]|nr:hypothetical protein [Halomonas sp.]